MSSLHLMVSEMKWSSKRRMSKMKHLDMENEKRKNKRSRGTTLGVTE